MAEYLYELENEILGMAEDVPLRSMENAISSWAEREAPVGGVLMPHSLDLRAYLGEAIGDQIYPKSSWRGFVIRQDERNRQIDRVDELLDLLENSRIKNSWGIPISKSRSERVQYLIKTLNKEKGRIPEQENRAQAGAGLVKLLHTLKEEHGEEISDNKVSLKVNFPDWRTPLEVDTRLKFEYATPKFVEDLVSKFLSLKNDRFPDNDLVLTFRDGAGMQYGEDSCRLQITKGQSFKHSCQPSKDSDAVTFESQTPAEAAAIICGLFDKPNMTDKDPTNQDQMKATVADSLPPALSRLETQQTTQSYKAPGGSMNKDPSQANQPTGPSTENNQNPG